MIYCYDLIKSSDARKKENIRDITNALDLVLQLKPVKYDFKKDFIYDEAKVSSSEKEKYEKERKDQIGFLAQDVEKIIPEVVVYDESTDNYGIAYSRFIPILA
ncbi:MAG: tail fiber domain-containing protein [Prolixibacteraceae bacterium]